MQGARPDSKLMGRGRGGAWENLEGHLQAWPVSSPASTAHQGTTPAFRIRVVSVPQGRAAAEGTRSALDSLLGEQSQPTWPLGPESLAGL